MNDKIDEQPKRSVLSENFVDAEAARLERIRDWFRKGTKNLKGYKVPPYDPSAPPRRYIYESYPNKDGREGYARMRWEN